MTNELNLVENVGWKKEKKDNLFFSPIVSPIEFKGKRTPWSIVSRSKDGEDEPIACVGETYGLVENSDIHKIVTGFTGFPLSLNLDRSANWGDKRFELVYDIETDEEFGGSKEDGGLSPQLMIQNSYNGTCQLQFEFGLWRLVCSNGLMMPIQKTMRVSKKHFKTFFMQDGLKKMLTRYLDDVISAPVFDKVRSIVEGAKGNQQSRFNFDLLTAMPMKVAIPFVYLLSRYSEIPVETYLNNLKFDLSSEDDAADVARRIADRKLGKDNNFNYNKSSERYVDVGYPETINSHWAVYNLLIKILQIIIVRDARRSIYTKAIGHYML